MATYGTYNTPGPFKLAVYGIVILAAFWIMGYIVRDSFRELNPGPINQSRAAERIEARKKITAEALDALKNGGTADPARGIIRLPIDRAMQLTVQAYQNPETALTNWVARAQKAAAPPPEISFE